VLRIVHVSDIHFWRYPANPLHLLNKRIVGVGALALGRASKFRLERVQSLVDRVVALQPDHILISGDLTTTALEIEFRAARHALEPWLRPQKVTIVPGNHDRYTGESARNFRFERYFGEFAPKQEFPWIRWIDARTGILAFDPTRPGLTARGELPVRQLEEARRLVENPESRPERLLVACHYPLQAPVHLQKELHRKSLRNARGLTDLLTSIGRHIYCCGHVHAAWAFIPSKIPDQLCLNAGSPLFQDPTHRSLPGFLEIFIQDEDVKVIHHAWSENSWRVDELWVAPSFFGEPGVASK